MVFQQIGIFLWFIRETAAHVIRHNDPVVVSKKAYEIAIIKGPGRIAVQHNNRTTLPLVKIGECMTVNGDFLRGERILYIVQHVLRFI